MLWCRVAALAFSFNGGKDSTVVLHILRAAMALRYERLSRSNGSKAPPFSGVYQALCATPATLQEEEASPEVVTRCIKTGVSELITLLSEQVLMAFSFSSLSGRMTSRKSGTS